MLTSQKLSLRMSEIRSRMGELAETATRSLDPAQRTEIETLRNELTDKEARFRAALAGESGEDKRLTNRDAEGVEFRALMRRSNVAGYVGAALAGQPIQGAEAEAAQAVNLTGPEIAIPWPILATDAATSIATGVEQEHTSLPILDRVFRDSAAMFMGVTMESVPVGDVSYVSLSAGQTTGPAFVAAGTAKDAEAFTLSAATAAPKRIAGRFVIRIEDIARLNDYEQALRRDLTAHLSDTLDLEVITGDGSGQHLSGLIKHTPSANKNDDPDSVHSATAWLGDLGSAVDGYYASMTSQVCALLGPASYRLLLAASTLNYPSAAGLLTDVLGRASGGMRASAFIPAPASNIQKNLFVGKGSMKRLATMPVWEGVRLIRDEYTGAAKGEVAVTVTMLCNLVVHRAAAYQLRAAKVA